MREYTHTLFTKLAIGAVVLALLLVGTTLFVVQAQGLKKGRATENQLITLDLRSLLQENGYREEPVGPGEVPIELPESADLNIAKFEDGNITCYVLLGKLVPATPSGIACVK